MKEFLITLKQTEKVTKAGLFYCLGMCILGAGFGLLMSLSMIFAWETRNHLGTLMIVMVMAIQVVSCGMLVFPAYFQQALALGKVRKYLFAGNYLLWLRNTLVVLLIVLGAGLIEEVAYFRVIGESVRFQDMELILSNPLVFVTILLCVPAVILFLGAMILRFGIYILWGFAGLYLLAVGIVRLKANCPDCAVMKWLGVGGEPNIVGICMLCLVGGAVMLGLAWLVLRKQRVVI